MLLSVTSKFKKNLLASICGTLTALVQDERGKGIFSGPMKHLSLLKIEASFVTLGGRFSGVFAGDYRKKTGLPE